MTHLVLTKDRRGARTGFFWEENSVSVSCEKRRTKSAFSVFGGNLAISGCYLDANKDYFCVKCGGSTVTTSRTQRSEKTRSIGIVCEETGFKCIQTILKLISNKYEG